MTSQHYIRQRAAEILTDPLLWPLTVTALQMDAIEAKELFNHSPELVQRHLEHYLTGEATA